MLTRTCLGKVIVVITSYVLFVFFINLRCRQIPTNHLSSEAAANDTASNSTQQPAEQITLVNFPRCFKNYTLIILVQVKASNFIQRTMVRNTWGNTSATALPLWKTVFLVTQSASSQDLLQKEHVTYDDLVIGDMHGKESFYTLDYKLKMGFRWSILHCNFNFLLKSDDDIFVNIPRLFDFLTHEDTPRRKLYAGSVQYNSIPSRRGRYGVSREEYPRDMFARYASGGAFLLSDDVVVKLLGNWDHVMPLKIEDARIGEIALSVGVDVVHSNWFKMNIRCIFKDKIIVQHPVKSTACMEYLYQQHKLDEAKRAHNTD